MRFLQDKTRPKKSFFGLFSVSVPFDEEISPIPECYLEKVLVAKNEINLEALESRVYALAPTENIKSLVDHVPNKSSSWIVFCLFEKTVTRLSEIKSVA